jgi:uncharacterized protein YdgA (DUF945 family)
MKKLVFCSGLCLVVVLGLAPYWFGRQAEPIFHTFVKQAGAATHLRMRTTQYHRGWFRSTAETVVTLPPQARETLRLLVPDAPMVPGRAVVLTMSHTLFHGPFPLAMFRHGQVSLAPVQMYIATVIQVRGGGATGTPPGSMTVLPGQIATVIALAGGGWSTLTLPAGQVVIAARHPTTLRWQPLHGQVNFAANGRQLTGTFSSAEVVGQSVRGSLTAQELQLHMQGSTDGPQRYQGHLVLQGDRLDVVNQKSGQQPVTVQGWSLQNRATVAQDSTDTITEARVQAIQMGNTHYGPGTGTLAMRRLHTMALLTLAQTFLPQSQRHTPGLLSFGSLFKMLPVLLKQAPEVEITQVSLHSSAGEAHGQAKIALDSRQAPGVLTFLRPLHMIEGQGQGVAPVALLQQVLTPAFLEQLAYGEQQGYIVRKGETYVFSARFTQGQLLVNDKPVALSLSGG